MATKLEVNDVRIYRSAHSPNQVYVQTCLTPPTGILCDECFYVGAIEVSEKVFFERCQLHDRGLEDTELTGDQKSSQ